MKYTPRNDFVLMRVEERTVGKLHMPDKAQEGKATFVVACGPDVTGLEPGDRVLAIGTPGEDLVRLPGESRLFVTRQANVICVVGEDER